MKKNILLILILLPIALLCAYVLNTDYNNILSTTEIKRIDSGFDADYGGSSDWGSSSNNYYSGGSSSDSYYSSGSSSSDYYSSSRSSNKTKDRNYTNNNTNSKTDSKEFGIILGICLVSSGLIALTIFIIYKMKHRVIRRSSLDRKAKYWRPFSQSYANTTPKFNSMKPIPPIVERDKDLEKFVYDTYVKIQEAWMRRDLSPVKHLLSDEMYNMYEKQLDTLRNTHQVNIMKDFVFIDCQIFEHKTTSESETLKVILSVNCSDFITSEAGFVLKGGPEYECHYMYELAFFKDIINDKQICPNCGAPLQDISSNNCDHCGSKVYTKASGFTLTDKKMLSQFSTRRDK